MDYRYLKVHPQLCDYVRTVLVFEHNPGNENSDLPLFTRGTSALLCRTKSNNYQITLFGQSVPDDSWKVEEDATIIVFFFKPFALNTIFKISAQKLKEKPVELNLWNAQKAMALSVQLFHSKSTEEKIEIVNYFLLTQIQVNKKECETVRYATDILMEDPGTDILSKLLPDLHLTERTFQRIFKKYVGITANEYRRICQFYLAFSQLKGGHYDKLTDVAYHNGYFDQSHYIRSFKEFTETTPKEYLQYGLSKKNE